MINLYGQNETDFTKNGLATLNPISATFSVDINGAWSLVLMLPYDKEKKYEKVEKNLFIACDLDCIREQASRQIFRIYDIKRNLTDITVTAFPVGMEATYDVPIEELRIPAEDGVATASGADAAAVLNNYARTHDDNSKYTLTSTVTRQANSSWQNTNLIAAISGTDENSFVNKWGGEVAYDNYNITIKPEIGNKNADFPVVYGRNLTGMEHNEDFSQTITRAYPLANDGLRLHQYDDLEIDYWYGTFEDGERKNYAKSQYLYSHDYHAWYYFDVDGKMSKEPIPAEILAVLNTYDWHEDETGWYYGDGIPGSGQYIANAWVEGSTGKHYWMNAEGYLDDQWTDTETWTWNQYDSSGAHYGEKRNSFVDSKHIHDYPYVRSAFLQSSYELLDTDTESNSETAQGTREWTAALLAVVEGKAEELWNAILNDTTNTYNAEYIQDLISGDDNSIIKYTQARYAFSHKGWQSLIKSCISKGIEWIKDVELADEEWIAVNGYIYGDFDTDGNFKNYPKSQYLYSYSEGKWYWFGADGLMSTEEIPEEKLAELNNYDWRNDGTGEYYGDGQGHYIANGWVENSNGTHSWVNAEGYYEAQWDDSEPWEWTNINGWRYGRSSTQYVRSCYKQIGKYLEYFGADGFWRDWMRISIEDMGWYQVKEGANAGKWWYGSTANYYAHNEYVYKTVDGTMMEWWYDEEGWWDEDQSGESEYAWQGDASTGVWFGTVDSETGEKDNYIHDKWAWIDGTYYWFDSDGYISGDANKAKQDYQWGDLVDEVTGKHWFGNENEDYERMWLSSQWYFVDGEWYYFDSDGYMADTTAKRSQTVTWFSNEIMTALNPVAEEKLKTAYDLLYNLMTAWVSRQYENGLDKPSITVTVDLVDLSKTTEYADYQNLEQIYLGDGIKCVDYVHNMSINARVMGLTYDVIRGYNTKVTIGKSGQSLSQILAPNSSGASSDTNYIAGDGLKIDGQVISAESVAGTSYGIQDATYKGASVVSGNVAILDNCGAEHREVWQSEYDDLPDSKNSDDVIYFIRDGGINPHEYISSITATFGNEELTDTNDIYMLYSTSATGEVTE